MNLEQEYIFHYDNDNDKRIYELLCDWLEDHEYNYTACDDHNIGYDTDDSDGNTYEDIIDVMLIKIEFADKNEQTIFDNYFSSINIYT